MRKINPKVRGQINHSNTMSLGLICPQYKNVMDYFKDWIDPRENCEGLIWVFTINYII